MSEFYQQEIDNVRTYCERRGLRIAEELGAGFDGIVFATTVETAIKALRWDNLFQREVAVYHRLQEHGIDEIEGFTIPRLVNTDAELRVVEMETVTPPFVLDFAGARLDERPDWPEEVLLEWEVEKREQFGDEWVRVQLMLAVFRRYGIYLADVKPGNVAVAHPG